MAEKILSCIDCGVKACRGKGGEYPAFCPSVKLEPELLQLAESGVTDFCLMQIPD